VTHCERTGKITYASAQDAWIMIRARTRKSSRFTHKKRAVEGNAYRCPACGGWHITRQGYAARGRHIPWEVSA
jgi:hypothetical protein